VLLQRPPTQVLLPSAPPEREAAIAHVPARTTVPSEKAEAHPAELLRPPVPHKIQRAKARPKKRTTVTRQAG
jgi:hypothetical protein